MPPKSVNDEQEKTQTEIWEEEHLRVLSKCSPELLKITGKHSTLWNYSKLETMEKLASLLTAAREQGVEEERAWWVGNIRLANGEGKHAKNRLVDKVVEERKPLTERETERE